MKTSTKELSSAWQMLMLMMFAAVLITMPDLAFADATPSNTDNPIGTVFCNAVNWFTGTTGKGIATIAIIVIGVGALMGKVSWGMAIIVGIGVALIFGSASMVDAITGTGADGKCGDTSDVGSIK